MLDQFIHTNFAQRRHLATPFGPYLNQFLAHRQARGFSHVKISADLKHVAAFGEYLAQNKHTNAADIGEQDIEEFIEHYRTNPRRHGPKRGLAEGSTTIAEGLRGSLRALLAFLRHIEVTPDCRAPHAPHEDVLSEYLSFLHEHRGFAERTIEQHRRWSRAFLSELNSRDVPADLAKLSVEDVEDAAISLAEGLGRRSRQIMTTTIESFLRFLRSVKHIPPGCVPFLPRMRTYGLTSLPFAIPWSDVESAIEGMDRSDVLGRRNYAMTLLVAVYGLRSSEVVGLRLDDIDWRHGILHVRQNKTRRVLDLPLVTRVRDALIDYLRNGRPSTRERRVFLKVHAPRGSVSTTGLHYVVRRALMKAGIDAPHLGPQALRHSRATSMIRSGKSLKTIGDLLGHRVPEATLIYCKVALDDLRAVALELPEVQS
jgi:site-specific recombinase XerD